MPKDKYGVQLTWKEFFARWKSGIEQVTELQKVRTQIFSTWIVIVGLLCGIVISLFKISQFWWLLIILAGALLNTLISQLGLHQRKKGLELWEYPQENEMEVIKNEINEQQSAA
jgi:hypothetical protein